MNKVNKIFALVLIAAMFPIIPLMGSGKLKENAPQLNCEIKTDKYEYVQTLEKNANQKSSIGETSLHKAAKDGHDGTVRFFIAKGADINAMDGSGQTPLYFAAKSGHKETVKILIAAGADVNVRCTSFRRTAIFWPCANGYTDVAEILIANGADVNVRERSGQTPLLWAIGQNRVDIIRLLITNGADLDAKDTRNYSGAGAPLHIAVNANKKEIVKLLLDGGADPNALDINGNTPRERAIIVSNKKLAEFISSYKSEDEVIQSVFHRFSPEAMKSIPDIE